MKFKREAGFTIIELMIATAVFAIVLILMVLGVINFYRGFDKANITASTQNVLQNVVDNVANSLKFSNASNPSSISGQHPTSNNPASGWPNQNYWFGYCSGNIDYSYHLDETLGQSEAFSNQTLPNGYHPPTGEDIGPPFVLYEMPAGSTCDLDCNHPSSSCTNRDPWQSDAALWNRGVSLIGDHYRLLVFSIALVNPNGTGSSGGGGVDLWLIDVKIAYTSGGSNDGDDLLCAPGVNDVNGKNSCSPNSAGLNYSEVAPNAPNVICKPGTGSTYCYVAELKTTISNRLLQ